MELAGERGVELDADRDAYAIKQQLQVANFSASLGNSRAGNPAITNMSGTLAKVRQRLIVGN